MYRDIKTYFVHVHVCMSHACMHVHVHVCMSTCMYVCPRACMYVHVHECMSTCMYVCPRACMYVHVHVYTQSETCLLDHRALRNKLTTNHTCVFPVYMHTCISF